MEARASDVDADVQRRQDASNGGRHVRRCRHPGAGTESGKYW